MSPHAQTLHAPGRAARLLSPALAALALALALVLTTLVSPARAASTTVFSAAPAGAYVSNEGRAVELGTTFTATAAGSVTGARYWHDPSFSGRRTATLWSADGRKLASATFPAGTAKGWVSVSFPTPVPLTAGARYVISYTAPDGLFMHTQRSTPSSASSLVSLPAANAGVYGAPGAFPRSTWNGSVYWADVVVAPAPATGGGGNASNGGGAVTPPPTTTTPTGSFPDAASTGPTTTSFTDVPGQARSGPGWYVRTVNGSSWIEVTGAGTTLSNIRTPLPIHVMANNVTIRNVIGNPSGDTWGIGIYRGQNTLIENVEIGAPAGATRLKVGIKDIYGDAKGTIVRRTEIYRVATGIQFGTGTAEANYIHDVMAIGGDHSNGITSNASTGQLTLKGNTILVPINQTDAIGLFQDFGPQRNVLIQGNLLAGGSYSLYGGAGQGKAQTSNIVIRDNVFSTRYFAKVGIYGPVTAFDPKGPGNVWSNNTYESSKAAVAY